MDIDRKGLERRHTRTRKDMYVDHGGWVIGCIVLYYIGIWTENVREC